MLKEDNRILDHLLDLYRKDAWSEIRDLWNEKCCNKLVPYRVYKSFHLIFSSAAPQLGLESIRQNNNAKYTVITINYNNKTGLVKTINSVLDQTSRSDIQFIIVDGGSTDGSLEYISTVSDQVDISVYGRDAGVYDAMNRGLEFAKSKYTLFMNSGDIFANDLVIQKVNSIIDEDKDNSIAFYGSTLLSDGKRWSPKPLNTLWKGMICSHQSIFIETSFLQSIGLNNENTIVSDFESIYRASLQDRSFRNLKMDISQIEDVGISSDFEVRTKERWQVVKSYKNASVSVAEIDKFYSNLLNSSEHNKNLSKEPVSDVGSRLIFLISMPRSGSTMLQKILDQSPDIGTLGEPWVMLPLLSMYDSNLIEARYSQNLSIKAAEEFLETIENRLAIRKAQRSYADQIYISALEYTKTSRFLDKTPRYVHISDKLAEIYPEAKFIVLLRNPASIISSYAHTWAQGNYERVQNTSEYMYDFDHGFAKLAEFVESKFTNKLIIKYEELVSNPEVEAKKIFEYLKLPFSSSHVNYGNAPNQAVEKYTFGDPETVYSKVRPDSSHAEKWIVENESPVAIKGLESLVSRISADVFSSMGYQKSNILEKINEQKKGKSLILEELTQKYTDPEVLKFPSPHLNRAATLGVLVTCYNNEDTIRGALDSIVGQSRQPDVIVVADDKSTDNSIEIIREYIDNNGNISIDLIEREKNVGVASNRDQAIRDMDVDFFSTLDGDDLFFPKKLAAEWNALSGSFSGVSFSNILQCLEGGKEVVVDTSDYENVSQELMLEMLIGRLKPVPRDMMLSKRLYLSAGGFDHGISLYEDWGFKQRLSQVTPDKSWVHSGVIGTVYDRRSPGLSAKHPMVHAYGELIMLARNAKILQYNNPSAIAGFRSLKRHMADGMRERVENFLTRYPAQPDMPQFMFDALRFLWMERGAAKTTDDMAKTIWRFFSPPLETK